MDITNMDLDFGESIFSHCKVQTHELEIICGFKVTTYFVISYSGTSEA